MQRCLDRMVPWRPTPPTRPERAEAHRTEARRPARTKGFFRRFWWVFLAVPAAVPPDGRWHALGRVRQIELPDTLPPIRTSYLFDRNGTQLTALHGAVDRTIVPLGQMSEHLQHACSPPRTPGSTTTPASTCGASSRAAWTNLREARHRGQGASTITQQLVKNVYAGEYIDEPQTGRSEYVLPGALVKEKVREALLAIKLEQELGKDKILAKYLNTVYFGHGAYGVEAAAQTYFGKAASELTVMRERPRSPGCCTRPSLYDPIKSTFDNEFRRDYTLDQMVMYGYITRSEAAELKAKECCGIPKDSRRTERGSTRRPTPSTSSTTPGSGCSTTPVRQREGLRGRAGGHHLARPRACSGRPSEAVNAHLPETDDNPAAALVSIDIETGEVLAMVGGRNWQTSRRSTSRRCRARAAASRRGRRSSRSRWPPRCSRTTPCGAYWHGPVDDRDPATTSATPTGVLAAGERRRGPAGTFTLLDATAAFGEHGLRAAGRAAQGARRCRRHGAAPRHPSPNLIRSVRSRLGSVAVNPLEMTNAYATIADPRLSCTGPRRCTRSLAPNGDVIRQIQPTKREPVRATRTIADQVTYALRASWLAGPASAAIPDRVPRRREDRAPRRTTWTRGSAGTPRSSPPASGSAIPASADAAREHRGRAARLRRHDPRRDLAATT